MKRYQKKVQELEQEKKSLEKENEELRYSLANLSVSDDGTQKPKENYFQKCSDLEEQVSELKRKLDSRSPFSRQKPRSDDAIRGLQDEISRIKAQKVELQRKIKEESVQFRLCKSLLEKEVLQLKKEATRKECEMHKLLSLGQRLKLVLQRKTEEASMATKRLKDVLEYRDASSGGSGKCPRNRTQATDREIEVKVTHGASPEYEHQTKDMAMIAKEVAELKEAEILKQKDFRCLLQDIEADCREKDSEIKDLLQDIRVDCREKDWKIRDLKEQVVKLKAELVHKEMLQNLTPMENCSMEVAANSREPRSSIISNSAGSNNKLSEVKSLSESKLNNAPELKFTLGGCCSCSKKSLCKTTKCECRAAGGPCGTSCGCTPSKCSNKEAEMVDGVEKCSATVEAGDVGPRRKPLSNINNNTLVKSDVPEPPNRGRKSRKPVQPKVSKKCAMEPDIPSKLTRATRSSVSKTSDENDNNHGL